MLDNPEPTPQQSGEPSAPGAPSPQPTMGQPPAAGGPGREMRAPPGPGSDLEAPMRRVLREVTGELGAVVAGLTDRVSGAASDLQVHLEASRALPARIAEGMAAIGQAVGEAAAAQALVDERLEKVEAGDDQRRSDLAALRQDLRDQVTTLRGEVKGALDAVAASLRDGFTDRRSVDDDLVAEVRRTVTDAVEELRTELEELHARVEDWGKPRTSPRVTKDLRALEDRVDELDRVVREDLVDAVSERMERTFELRFEALIHLLESRVRQLSTPIPPEATPRAGLFRRSVG